MAYREFYTCVVRLSDLPDRIALAKKRAPGITDEQVRAYYAQYPIAKVWRGDDPCFAQYWRIPDTVWTGTSNGEQGVRLAFPTADSGQPVPAEGIDGLGTANVTVNAYSGGIPGRFLEGVQNFV